MADNPITSDAGLLALYKEYYSAKRVQNLLFRMSPFVSYIPKIKIEGKTYNFAAMYGVGGAASGSYTIAVANAANGQVANVQFAVTPGRIHSVFNINQLEKLASRTDRGAFAKMATDKMFAATYAARQQMAASLYGMGYGECGTVLATVASTGTTMSVDDATIVKLNVGTTFQTATAVPSGALNADGPFTITDIDASSNTVTFTRSGTTTAIAAGDYIEYYGGRTAGGAPLYPTGLGGWVPYIYSRVATSAWTTYIATAFFGVDRSVDVSKMAGSYYNISSVATTVTTPYSQAITNGVRLVRRQGGVPEIIALNDSDYATIQTELQVYQNFWQSVDIKKNMGPQLTYGIEQLRYAFSSNYLEYVWDDPFCPVGKAWILEAAKDQEGQGGNIEFAGLSNVDKPTKTTVEGNNPGADPVDGEADPTANPFEFLIDDYLNVQPGTDTVDGPAARVSLSIYGNWVVHDPAHACVVELS